VPPVTITAPNTAVTWGAGSIRTITWNHVLGAAQTFDIATSADNGVTWAPLASGVPAATATTGTFTGPMPATVTTQALVRVSPAGTPALGGVSAVPFTLATPALAVTSPNTKVTWAIGSTQNITWSHNLGIAESVLIELSGDGGITWTTIIPSAPNTANTSGTFSWVVSGPATTAARVRLTWVNNTSVQSVSSVNFTTQ
jgi:hypothetical protein